MSVLVRKEVWRKNKGETEKLQWFLGKLSQDDAATILKDQGDRNTYVVYNHPSKNAAFALALRLPHDDNVAHFDILYTDGRYKVSGQTQDYDDVIKAVHDFVAHYSASLRPASDPTSDAGLRHPALASPQREDTSTVSITCTFPDSPPPYQGAEKVEDASVETYNDIKTEPHIVLPLPHENASIESPNMVVSHNRDLKSCPLSDSATRSKQLMRLYHHNNQDQSSDCSDGVPVVVLPNSRDLRHRSTIWTLCIPSCVRGCLCLSGHDK
eukprot:Em0022g580a